MKKLFLRFPLLFSALILFLIYTVFVLFFFNSNGSDQSDPETRINPTVTPNPFVLTDEEDRFPEATPQPFRHQEESATGTLIVTSNPEDAIVFLDIEDHPDSEDPIPPEQEWPQNTTPFKVENMPVGEHVLKAFKIPTHDMDLETFIIRENEITRVHIELVPLETSD